MFDTIDISPTLGSRVSGLDLSRDISPATMRALADLLFDRGFIVIPAQTLTDADYVAFARHFGNPLEFFIPEHRNPDHPEIIYISNDPAIPPSQRDGAVHWHSDSSYETVPGAVTMLYGKEAPATGGETHFASTTAAYEALDPDERTWLDTLVACHELGRAPWIDGETRPDANRPRRQADAPEHPLIMVHPLTGRRGIFTSGTAYAIKGMPDDDATRLIHRLREHVAKPEFATSYKIQPGDIVLWDNFSTVHCASPIAYSSHADERRLLYRISTKGVPAVYV